MRFRINGFASIAVAIIIIVSGSAFITSRLFAGLTDNVERSQFGTMQAIVETAIADAENKALARAELIADMPRVKALFAARDRDGLNQELAAAFATQRARHGIDQGQFHVLPAVSFLRLHDPATFGDDLSTFRPIVVTALRDRTPLKGITIARKGPALIGITPVEDATGNFIGTFEIGLDFGPLLASLKNAYGMDAALFVDEKTLISFAAGVDPERMGDRNRVGRYIRFDSTNTERMSVLAGPDDLAVVSEPKTLIKSFNGAANGVLLFPLNNSAGTHIGVIAVAADFSASRAATDRSLIWQAVIAIIAIVLLVGFVIIMLRGFVTRPLQQLDQKFAAILNKEPPPPIEDTDHYPDEVQRIVDVYKHIQGRRQTPKAIA